MLKEPCSHKDLAQVFKALSDPTRLRMLRLLAVNETEMCVCEFVDCLKERQYNVSKQLKILETSGLIVGEKDGRFVYYGLTPTRGSTMAQVHRLVAKLPVGDAFAHDQQRFDKRVSLRSGGRCRVGIQTPTLAE